MFSAPTFAEIQARYADVAGEKGAALRRQHYARYFLKMGRDVHIEEGCRFYHPDRIVLEDGVRINIGALIYGSGGITFGRHVRVGPRCFIHSANHDVTPSALPMSQRGYETAPVALGDHTLISANVSILPGANIGAHGFAACGAVITGKTYGEHARLMGVPATVSYAESQNKPELTPSIAFIARDDEWMRVAQHLATTLGVPHVTVKSENENLPASVHSVILFGPESWQPKTGERAVWKLRKGDTPIHNPALPKARPAQIATLDTPLSQAVFWLDTRLMKGVGRLSPQEYDAWLTTLKILNLSKARADGLGKRWKARIHQRRPHSRLLSKHALATASLSVKSILGHPDRFVRAVIDKRIDPAETRSLLLKCLDAPTNATRLVAYAIVARLLNEKELAARIEAILGDSTFPLQSENGKARCYSPLIVAWHVLKAGRDTVPEGCGQLRDASVALTWHGFSHNAWWDDEAHIIAADLVSNWSILHQQPVAQDEHYMLLDKNYDVDTCAIEKAWHELLRTIQHQAKEPFIRILPWPSGYDAALSLRYDVDRPITPGKITQLTHLQMAQASAHCASWYYFHDHPHREEQDIYLRRHWQEKALHIECDSEAEAAIGATHHSAPSSAYWRGDSTNATLATKGAAYGEWLGMNLYQPRPAFHHPNLWLTPLHFPLEASTRDTSLRYFNRLLPNLRKVLAQGGHVIIGSHPDLNRHLMARAIQKVISPRMWCAPVGDVVKRARAIFTHVAAIKDEKGDWSLYSPHSISDVTVLFWPAGETAPQKLSEQLVGGFAKGLKK